MIGLYSIWFTAVYSVTLRCEELQMVSIAFWEELSNDVHSSMVMKKDAVTQTELAKKHSCPGIGVPGMPKLSTGL